jgi:hypothetical protein
MISRSLSPPTIADAARVITEKAWNVKDAVLRRRYS